MSKNKSKFKKDALLKMHHEIRNPLNVLLGFIQIIIHDSNLSDNERKHYLEIIKSSANNLLNNIDNILELSKNEKY